MSTNQQQTQSLGQKQNMFLMQQKLQLLHMMHLSSSALDDFIKIQLEENPALEAKDETFEKTDEILSDEERLKHEGRSLLDVETYFNEDDYPDYKTYASNTTKDAEQYVSPIVNYESFQDYIKNQIQELNINLDLLSVVKYLIDSLEDDGYLRRDLSDIIDDYAFSEGICIEESIAEKALMIIQNLEPPGIAARSLQECLMLQLKRKDSHCIAAKNALTILTIYFSELATKNFLKLRTSMNINEIELNEAFLVISHLSPRPVFIADKSLNLSLNIVPEFIIQLEQDDLVVSLANDPTFILRINESYKLQSIIPAENKLKRSKDQIYYRKKVDEAKWFIEALQQRENSFIQIIKAIAVLQREYFLTGDQCDLRPMILKDIADKTGFELSTISRVTSNKYVQTPFGNVLLKNLFSNGLVSKTGISVSVKKIKEVLKDIIIKEDKLNPFNDMEIIIQLGRFGYTIARRTVVKYRDALNIPNARMRKQIIY